MVVAAIAIRLSARELATSGVGAPPGGEQRRHRQYEFVLQIA
jgi:hypothetical protein